MGLGSVKENGGATFLSIAGGYIWDRKADSSHPDFATQDYEKADKSTGTRQGARYADLTGDVTKVEFRTHKEYGENMNVTVEADGDVYIISVSTNNRNCQDFMKALMVMDLKKPLFIKPYDFVGNDKKRAQGISFRQDGEKLALKVEVPEEYRKEAEWFKNTDKKKIKRFFEDLSDWFVAEIEENIIPKIQPKAKEVADDVPDSDDADDAPNYEDTTPKESKKMVKEDAVEDEPAPVTPLRMKKILREYIVENYPGKELPELSKEDLVKWFKLSQQEEELPFSSDDLEPNELSADDLENELNKLL